MQAAFCASTRPWHNGTGCPDPGAKGSSCHGERRANPIVHPVPILSLRPTQMTVGMREVKEKRKRWREHESEKKHADLLGKHMIPVVLGPDARYYVDRPSSSRPRAA